MVPAYSCSIFLYPFLSSICSRFNLLRYAVRGGVQARVSKLSPGMLLLQQRIYKISRFPGRDMEVGNLLLDPGGV